jgi:hypothetical protein
MLLAALVRVQAQDASGGMNPLLDPFATTARPAVPLPPPKSFSVPLPALAPAVPSLPTASLPVGLRVLLIRDQGVGLLGTADTQASSVAVAHGKLVRIGEQDYMAEVTASEVRLFTPNRSKLVWQGTLGGPAPIQAPVDMTQAHFTPPLSAGVNPGLRAVGTSGVSADALIRKNGTQ